MSHESFFQSSDTGNKFGTFGGVFTPTILTILGAIMYLREGWVVGNAGLLGAFAIIIIANVITISTGLSISSVATNIRVRAGGAFSIISQSLGLEVGGSVSVPLYLALAISVGFYIFAFAEGYHRIFPTHPEWLVVFVAFALAFLIAYLSANLVVRVQFIIMGIIFLSLIAIFLGAFPILGQQGMVYQPEMWGQFESGSFWQIFAVFFPAVTGVLAGVNMSGDLKDPRESIPKGMLSAVVLTFVIYLLLAYWLARVATPAELIANETIMVDRAVWGPAVLAGLLAATFSSALSSLVGASRVLQAISEHEVLPGSQPLAVLTKSGEPHNAMWVTGAITMGTLVFGLVAGGINAIAPLITMFFLIMYATLNGIVLLEQTLGLISFRPLLRIPWFIPLIGLAGCLFVMFLINPTFSLIALILTILLYAYLSRRRLVAPWGDVRSGLFVTVAEWAAKRVLRLPPSERAWRPSLFVPVQSTSRFLGAFRLLHSLTYPRGLVHVIGFHGPDDSSGLKGMEAHVDLFSKSGIFSRLSMITVPNGNIVEGIEVGLDILRSVFFRPNVLFVIMNDGTQSDTLQIIVEHASQNEMGVSLFLPHPDVSLGREQVINVFVRDQSPNWEMGLRLSNLDLALLLAYQLGQNWGGKINLITVLSNEDERERAGMFLDRLINFGRMPRGTQAIVEVGGFQEMLGTVPQADISIFGIQPNVNVDFLRDLVQKTNSSCLFVRDSGQESALA